MAVRARAQSVTSSGGLCPSQPTHNGVPIMLNETSSLLTDAALDAFWAAAETSFDAQTEADFSFRSEGEDARAETIDEPWNMWSLTKGLKLPAACVMTPLVIANILSHEGTLIQPVRSADLKPSDPDPEPYRQKSRWLRDTQSYIIEFLNEDSRHLEGYYYALGVAAGKVRLPYGRYSAKTLSEICLRRNDYYLFSMSQWQGLYGVMINSLHRIRQFDENAEGLPEDGAIDTDEPQDDRRSSAYEDADVMAEESLVAAALKDEHTNWDRRRNRR